MTVAAGIRLGPYEILGPLGSGGMGEVYKARDTRLDRIVAIKVLREHLAADPDRRARFEREAKLISHLNHPNICTLYDVGQHDGRDADGRSDIFALGALLYEMLTGTRAFQGESQSSVIAAVLEREPASLAAAQSMAPVALDRVVRKCLAKNPDDRWQSARDL